MEGSNKARHKGGGWIGGGGGKGKADRRVTGQLFGGWKADGKVTGQIIWGGGDTEGKYDEMGLNGCRGPGEGAY